MFRRLASVAAGGGRGSLEVSRLDRIWTDVHVDTDFHGITVTVSAGPDSETDHADYQIVRLDASPQHPPWATSTVFQ